MFGCIKSNSIPVEVNVSKAELKLFDDRIDNMNFIRKHDFQSVEQINKYIDDCYKGIAYQKDVQQALKSNHINYIPLFKAIKNYRYYEKAYNLYQQSYTEMKDEHDQFMKARNTIDNSDFSIDELETTYSNYLDKSSEINEQIQYLKKEMSLSKKALKLHESTQLKVYEIDGKLSSKTLNEKISHKEMIKQLNNR